MTDVTFTAPDGTRIIDIGEFSLTLAEVPRRGQPLKIERVIIRNGHIHLFRDLETGGIKGLIPMLEAAPDDTYETESGESMKLSETLRLTEIIIEDVDVRYDEGSGTPLILDGLELHSEISPETIDGFPGWYEPRHRDRAR